MTPRRFLLMLALLVVTTAACTGAEPDYPAPIEALQARGVRIVGTFDAPGGLTGYAAISNHQPLSLYVTKDGRHVIVGAMLDSEGKFVHRETVRQMVAEPLSEYTWRQLKNSTWVSEGAENAPRTVYVFSDPNCPYCYMFWKQARPWIESGKVELRHVMVGVISKTSANKAAAILTAENPEQMLVKNKKQFPQGGIEPMAKVPAKIQDNLVTNFQLMRQLGLRGTPSIVYRNDQGVVRFWRGLPPESAMKKIFGPK